MGKAKKQNRKEGEKGMKKSTLTTCYHALVNALADREEDLARLDTGELLFESEEQKAEMRQYYERCIEEINDALAEVDEAERQAAKKEQH